MGCDGGTIPRRDELVRLKKKPEKKDKDSEVAAKWKSCALTQQQLERPIVACELGRLYNKDAIIELLLDRSKFEGALNCNHIKGLKDVKELQLTENPDYKGTKDRKGDSYVDRQPAEYICPVTGIEMRGVYRFIFLHGCGCVFSDRAMKEVKTETCHKCGKTFKEEDLVVINGGEEDVVLMRTNMERRRLQAKLEKKAKKKKAEATATSAASSSEDGPSVFKKPRTDAEVAGTSTAKIGGRLVNGKPAPGLVNGKPVPAPAAAGASGAAGGHKSGKTEEKPLKKPTSLQDDPTASKAYKSLFTTCEKAKNQEKAHWVTYNPCFY